MIENLVSSGFSLKPIHCCAPENHLIKSEVPTSRFLFPNDQPRNDHGAQVIGYQISILLDPKPNVSWLGKHLDVAF
jgi:hypothetical protein